MDNDDTILLRRRLLDRLDRAGAPLTIADLVATQQDRATAFAVRDAVVTLAELELITNRNTPEEPYYLISDAGRAQLHQTAAKLHLKIWGRLAL